MLSVQMLCCVSVLVVLLVGASTAVAQDPGPIAADRPGFGDGSALLAPQRFQVEAGYAFSVNFGYSTQPGPGRSSAMEVRS